MKITEKILLLGLATMILSWFPILGHYPKDSDTLTMLWTGFLVFILSSLLYAKTYDVWKSHKQQTKTEVDK